ncbi:MULTISPECIES: LysR family transcriptional regulator [Methylobacterium]|jgi:DNA-binding transcriptional LysR family regulator|uniref:LysR family transcriptional regulator n=1 Tax=Methylobacterium longum TaxID=767694 RepID=A0ABT8AJW6_9HYPH|nr:MULTISPECIES: LysR family transcriptional regulator [Methylobacterium]MCJ2102894.1 LysR family transcriptional regulator [Methylobacterium sp. E-046]MDN3570129.1 LysR family transcriptional regulator [Methylobacterium longum]GJE12206.1 HTH-type transcriptional regulator BenM [Methylobacterium longum]
MFDLGHARSFVAVAEEMHFGRAAAKLNLTQSPLSRQIQMLEQSLGVTLLDRTTRTVRLTPAGRTFLAEAYRVLGAAESATRITRRAARGESGVIRLSFTAASAYRTLPRVVAHVRAMLPEVDLVLAEMVSDEQILALEENRTDLAILRPAPILQDSRSSIATAPLVSERLLLAVPRSHRLANGTAPTLQDLDGEAFVTWSPKGGRYFIDLLDRLFETGGVAPRIVQRVNQVHAMLALVGAGIGIALVPASTRGNSMADIRLRPIALPAMARPELLLAWRRDNSNPCLVSVRTIALETVEV